MISYDGKSYSVSAVIAAGGSSRRMGFDKLAARLEDTSVLSRTIAAFECCGYIDEIVIVAQKTHINALLADVKQRGFTKIRSIVSGGDTRQKSVFAGVFACADSADIVCIHDAARPLVTDAVICDALKKAAQYGAATAAVPVKDTIKRGSAGMIEKTLPREKLWQIQTPQAFLRKAYLKAYNAAEADYSDDCQLFEHLGLPVALSMGDYRNIKLTTKEDFVLAAAFLKQMEEEKCE